MVSAPGTVERYLVRELTQSFLGILTVLLLISLSNTMALTLIKVAEGRLSADVLLVLLALRSVALVTVLVPLGLMLSIVMGLGRLYRDAEMTALMACGVGPARIYLAVFLFGFPLVVGLTWFSFYGMPWAARLGTELTHKAQQSAATSLTNPGQFRELDRGRIVAYAEAIGDQGELQRVFIRSRDDGREIVTTAARGRQHIDPETGARYVVLEDGLRTTVVAGQAAVETLSFDRLQILIDEDDAVMAGYVGSDEKPFAQLIGSSLPADISELHWRIAIPISACLVLLIGPPMAHSGPRQGRYLRVVLAVLIFVVYSNLLGIGRAWVESAKVPEGFGLWWVHLLVLAAAAVTLFRRGPYALRLKRGGRSVAVTTREPVGPGSG